MNDSVYHCLKLITLRTELSDILDYQRGGLSLWYVSFKSETGRDPTQTEIDLEIAKVRTKIKDAEYEKDNQSP